MTITPEIQKLFKTVRTKLGAPVRAVQLTDNQLCDLLEVAIGDYAEKVQNWVIESQWLNLMGNKTLLSNPSDVAYALTIRTMDWSRDFSYWFSREVGLQQRGNYELKKDFFKIEKGKQVYVIPAGREINKVLYVNPSTTKAALYGNLGTLDTGIAGGYGQYGNMGNGMGITGFYVGSAYDTALMAADLKYKNSLLRGDLAYKVTAGPNGTHLVHLMSTPGSPNMMGGLAADDTWGWNKYANCYCWYTYYDVGSDGDVTDCMIQNKDDILITPDQVPLDEMRYELMNYATQQTIRQLLTAEAMITLGVIRGTYSGSVKIPEAEMQMDYNMLLELGKTEKQNTMDALVKRLDEMLPWNIMEKQSTLTDNLMKVLQQKPLGGFYVK
nr:MAG TPA: hypothetical protein [Bacteriophage sp.]